MTLSSRDPHLGQRIVLNASITHNRLYRQCFRTRNLFDKLSDIISSMIFVFAPMNKRRVEIEWAWKNDSGRRTRPLRVRGHDRGSRHVFATALGPTRRAKAR